jgi:hypothetical protein
MSSFTSSNYFNYIDWTINCLTSVDDMLRTIVMFKADGTSKLPKVHHRDGKLCPACIVKLKNTEKRFD